MVGSFAMQWSALWQCNETKTLQEYEAACLPVACAFVCIQTKRSRNMKLSAPIFLKFKRGACNLLQSSIAMRIHLKRKWEIAMRSQTWIFIQIFKKKRIFI
jgi:hypothetical protein